MRVLTDLLLQAIAARVELDLHGVTFMNSAGLAVLVQVQRMTAPRAIELVLVRPRRSSGRCSSAALAPLPGSTPGRRRRA